MYALETTLQPCVTLFLRALGFSVLPAESRVASVGAHGHSQQEALPGALLLLGLRHTLCRPLGSSGLELCPVSSRTREMDLHHSGAAVADGWRTCWAGSGEAALGERASARREAAWELASCLEIVPVSSTAGLIPCPEKPSLGVVPSLLTSSQSAQVLDTPRLGCSQAGRTPCH